MLFILIQIQTENLRAELESRPAVTEIVMDTAELDAALAQNDALQVCHHYFMI